MTILPTLKHSCLFQTQKTRITNVTLIKRSSRTCCSITKNCLSRSVPWHSQGHHRLGQRKALQRSDISNSARDPDICMLVEWVSEAAFHFVNHRRGFLLFVIRRLYKHLHSLSSFALQNVLRLNTWQLWRCSLLLLMRIRSTATTSTVYLPRAGSHQGVLDV